MEDYTHEEITTLIEDMAELQETQMELVAIAERQQTIMETFQDALSSLLLALGILVGLVAVLIFSSGMRNAS